MFDPVLLQAFVAVADTSGFTSAADQLNSTQSTVSAQIRRLEEQLGCTLFTRNTRSVVLTGAGEILLGYARTILQLQEDARQRLTGKHPSGRLRLGVAEDLVDEWLPSVLQAFKRQHPDEQVELHVGVGRELFERFARGNLDLVVGGECASPQGKSLWSEPLVWVFAAHAEIPAVLPIAFFPEPCPYREAALRALASSASPWRITCSSSSLAGVRAAASAGLATTVLPAHAVGRGLRILAAEDGVPTLPEVSYVIRHPDGDPKPASLALEEIMRANPLFHVRALSSPG